MPIVITVQLDLSPALAAVISDLIGIIARTVPAATPVSVADLSEAPITDTSIPATGRALDIAVAGERQEAAETQSPRKWSPERKAIIRRDWPTGRSVHAIRDPCRRACGRLVTCSRPRPNSVAPNKGTRGAA